MEYLRMLYFGFVLLSLNTFILLILFSQSLYLRTKPLLEEKIEIPSYSIVDNAVVFLRENKPKKIIRDEKVKEKARKAILTTP